MMRLWEKQRCKGRLLHCQQEEVHASSGDEDYPEVILAGFVAEGQHAEQPAGGAAQDAEPEQDFFRDAPLVLTRGVFVEAKEQEGEEAEGEEEIKHEIGLQCKEFLWLSIY